MRYTASVRYMQARKYKFVTTFCSIVAALAVVGCRATIGRHTYSWPAQQPGGEFVRVDAQSSPFLTEQTTAPRYFEPTQQRSYQTGGSHQSDRSIQSQRIEAIAVPSVAQRALDQVQLNASNEANNNRSIIEAALDTISREYRRQAGNRATQSMGFNSVPNGRTYVLIKKGELPILGEPNIGRRQLEILGLAHSGDYFPVVEEREIEGSIYLSNPLSTTPDSAGKWCLVETATGRSGWIMIQPSGNSTVFASIFRPPAPPPVLLANNNSVISPAVVVAAIIIIIVFLFLAKNKNRPSKAGSYSYTQSSYDYEPIGYSSTEEEGSHDEHVKETNDTTPQSKVERESTICDEDGNPTHIRVTSEDGRKSTLYEYKSDFIADLTSNHKGKPVEVSDHHKDGTTDAYEYKDDIIADITGNHRGQKKNDSKCFLTTACVKFAGLDDDCHELVSLRRFRDSYVSSLPNGSALIAEYYSTAPEIVDAIDCSPNRAEILTGMLREIRGIVGEIESGRSRVAMTRYHQMFERLKTDLLVG